MSTSATSQTEGTSPALQTVLEFFDAWSSKDLERAMAFVADDIVVDSPNGRVGGADAYRESLQAWFGLFIRAEMIDAFAHDDRAVIIYDNQTKLVANVPACEYFGIENGKISYKRLIFDRGPFMAAQQSA